MQWQPESPTILSLRYARIQMDKIKQKYLFTEIIDPTVSSDLRVLFHYAYAEALTSNTV